MSTIPTDELVERASKYYDEATIAELVDQGDYDTLHVAAFAVEFKDLVRRYADYHNPQMLAQMQDKTSVYSPWIWEDREAG